MHYPGHLRDAFCEWVEAGMPGSADLEIGHRPVSIPAAEFCEMFRDCTDVLPREYCQLLDLAPGSTYAEAADCSTALVGQ